MRASKDIRFIDADKILAKAPEVVWQGQHPFTLPVTISLTFKRSGKSEKVSFGLVPDGLFGLEYFERYEAERENRVAASSLKPSSFFKKSARIS